jgi:integrase/recombinase XerD
MTGFPCLEKRPGVDGLVRYRLGHPLVDRYLEFVAGRARPNTLRATAFDLKTFFTVIGKEPVEVRAVDVFDFLGHQRGDRTVVRLADRESGLSARTIARRISTVSGFYAYVVARGDTAVTSNPVPRGLQTRRQGGTHKSRSVPLVRVPRTLPRILDPADADRLLRSLRTDRDRAMVLAMLLGGLRRCEMLGLRLEDVLVGDRRLRIIAGKGGHHRVVPVSDRFFETVGDYLHQERPKAAPTDQLFVALKGPRRGQPLSAEGVDEILAAGPRPGRAGTRHLPRAAPHLPNPAAGGRDGVGGGPGPGRAPLDRVHPHLSAPLQRLAGRRVSPSCRPDRLRHGRHRRDHRRPGAGRLMAGAPAQRSYDPVGSAAVQEWTQIAAEAPQMAATMGRYLRQVSTFLAPRSVDVADAALRQLAQWALANAGIETVAQFRRDDIEEFKLWLSARAGRSKGSLSANTHRQRLRTLRAFFERIIEWDWPDAPVRNPILNGEIPKKPDHCPSS